MGRVRLFLAILFIDPAVQTDVAAFVQRLAIGIRRRGSVVLRLGASAALMIRSSAASAVIVVPVLTVGTDDNVAVHVLALAPGGSAVDLLYRGMDDAALIGIHRL